MILTSANHIEIEGKSVKSLEINGSVVWEQPERRTLSLVTGSWMSFGLNISVDEAGIITLDGHALVSALFVRLTGSFLVQTFNTGITDGQSVFIPANTNIRFGVEQLDGSFNKGANSLNLVLRDTENAAKFNCMLGDDVWLCEGSSPTGLCCMVVYIKSTAVCNKLRLQPYIEIL